MSATFPSADVRRSYLKTTAVGLLAVLVLLTIALTALLRLTGVGRAIAVTLSMVAAAGFATLAGAGMLVLLRQRRALRGERDLFLALNASRDPDFIAASPVPRVSHVRRWLARRLLGHDLVVGDMVEVKSWAEIEATLDETGCLEHVPFMPEMLPMCGRRARVFRSAHRIFDYRKSRRMRHLPRAVLLVAAVCDGSHHGSCDASCHTIWQSAWLRRIEGEHMGEPADTGGGGGTDVTPASGRLWHGTTGPCYSCQLTQLNAASRPIGAWNAANTIRPLVAGNVTPAAFAVAYLTYFFNKVQYRRGGVGFPSFEGLAVAPSHGDEPRIAAGDHVVVKSSAEIGVTLDARMTHRGMGFELDMLKHCGGQYRVEAEVRRVIDIVTGEMRTMKTPAYILRDVHFSGERQLFNAQYEPLFWRALWLRRIGTTADPDVAGAVTRTDQTV